MPEDTIKPDPQSTPEIASQDFPASAAASPGASDGESADLSADAPDGILPIHKQPGVSSAMLVSQAKRLLPRKIKVGHAGTLDSFATGVLLILVGKSTRQCEALMSSPKEYEATIRFGATTETDDLFSPERPVAAAEAFSREALLAALVPLTGDVLQMPPTFSALKIGGRRASDRARDGEAVTLQPRHVRIDSITLLDYAWPTARIHVACGRGTYIRAIARDLGAALGVGGYLTQLCRTRVGRFTLEACVDLDTLTPISVRQALTKP